MLGRVERQNKAERGGCSLSWDHLSSQRGEWEGVQGRVGVTRHRSLLPPLPAQCAHGPPYRKLSAEQRRNPNYADSYMLVRSKYLQALKFQEWKS